MKRLIITALPCLTLVAACSPSSNGVDQTGQSPTLPDQASTLLPAIAIAPPVAWGNDLPKVPDGYTITAIAKDLKIPRQMVVLPNGDILVAEGSGGKAPVVRPKDLIAGLIKAKGKSPVKGGDRITLLRDANGDGLTDLQTTLISGLDAPYGLAFVNGAIYVANQGDLMRFPYADGTNSISLPGQKVTALPGAINHHWTKSLAPSPDGSKLYVGIGSNSNIAERGMDAEEDRAVVWEIDLMTGSNRVFASGIRNPTALAFDPWQQRLWAVANERDELGPELVPDYLTSVRDGGFYGWPYSYYGQNVDPRVHPQKPAMVAKAIKPDYALGSHVAALGLTFATNGGMGGAFSEGAFVGEHGSWNRSDRSGYKVVFVPFKGGRPAGKPVDFVSGFLADGKARGRPVGVFYDSTRGALLVADDVSNTVWRITRTGQSTRITNPRNPAL